MEMRHRELTADELRALWKVDDSIGETVDGVDLEGQRQAVEAIKFGLGMSHPAFNIYVAGPPGTGRTTLARRVAKEMLAGRPVPPDWCYVHNFKDPDSPKALRLEAGKGRVFAEDMRNLVKTLHREIPKAFDDDEMERRRMEATEDIRRKKMELFERLDKEAKEMGFQMQRSSAGIFAIPLKEDGSAMSEDEYNNLEEEEKEKIRRKQEELNRKIRETVAEARELDKKAKERIRDINRSIALFAVGHIIDELRNKYKEYPEISSHLVDVQEDILANIEDFRKGEQQRESLIGGVKEGDVESTTTRYLVNVVVDNSETEGAPVVEEINPTYNNLVGRIERKTAYGIVYTDFSMIKAGAILRANGGCLILHAIDVLTKPFAYEAIKNVIKEGVVRIEDIGQMYGIFPPQGIRPQPIPVDVRIIMIGSQALYHLLCLVSEDFRKIFKVKAEFPPFVKKSGDALRGMVSLLRRACKEEGLAEIDDSGVAEMLRYALRLSGDAERISMNTEMILDTLRECAAVAAERGSDVITAADVKTTLERRRNRSNLYERLVREMIDEGIFMIDTDGRVVGQVNGLSVHSFGDISFGRPSRITAQVAPGREGVVDIERKAELGGKVHRKGMLIISGFLYGRYGRHVPLSLTATVCFEQSYEGVEGDSASAAELAAIVSSIIERPVRQDIAVTGSVNQHGVIQPVGGVIEKVEGFFHACRSRGLTGRQGVIIPAVNVRNLVLSDEVVDAVERGEFHIYPVETVDEVFEILMEMPAGRRGNDGTYPEGTVNAEVEKKLLEFSERLKSWSGGDGKEEGEGGT